LARALDHGSIDYLSAEAFEARYNPSGTYFGGVREEIGRLPELRSRLRTHFMVRRMKRDVLTQLPQVRYEIDYVEETGAIKRALAAERMLDIDPSEFNSRIAIDGEVSTVRKEMGVAKAPHVAERVKTMLEGGLDKLVLFGWHREVLDMWEEKLREFSPERIDGSTSGAGKERAKNRFIKDPDCRLIFGNLMSMGVGVDGLQTVCDTVLFGENSWVPGDNQQGVDRLDRMGQTSRVTAIFLVAQGSIDEKIVSSAAKKTRTIHTALDAGL
jgi:SNF2 family DNA or RNA helicase